MGKMSKDPMSQVSFRCYGCGLNFSAEPTVIEDEPQRPWHPYRYQCACSACGKLADQQPWEVNLYKAHAKSTGPNTPEGIARSRFNGIKHGLTAKTATFFPARPGKYPQCDGCDFFDGCKGQVACQKRTELFMRHHYAYENRDPSMLLGLRAGTQAAIQAIIDDIVLSIIQKGVALESPKWYTDKDGMLHIAEYTNNEGEQVLLTEITANPLLKTLGDFLSKNGMTLSDDTMTMRQQGEEIAAVDDSNKPQGDELRAFMARSQEQQQSLMRLVQRSQSVIDVTPDQTNG